MAKSPTLLLTLKAARQLGFEAVSLFASYQLALRSGWLRRKTPPREPLDIQDQNAYAFSLDLVNIPSRDQLAQVVGDQASALLAEANDINQGKVRLFGGPPQDLDLVVPLPLPHWTAIALDPSTLDVEDIKYIWEPARFTWIYPLARAYILSGDESYVETFWQHFDAFTDINLPNMGPNWVSAQEIAIRLMSYTFAYQVFASAEASTPERSQRLSLSIAEHAERIPVTLDYARAQNNNHLLSEAAGLITSGTAIPAHPKAEEWRKNGWRWFNHTLQHQISDSGTYIQHSTNYHRLMLQLAIWVNKLDDGISAQNKDLLASATSWLKAMVDPDTGRVPNLGHNDGSYLQNLSSCSYADYRPVVQAAALAFLGEPAFQPGTWDEYPLWLGFTDQEQSESPGKIASPEAIKLDNFPGSHITIHDQTNSSWASFRVAQFASRPAHADQLHLDLWWREYNIALDPGTYLYNAPPPWTNALAKSMLHNTLTINDQDQMTFAGRFLWLDWAQAEVLEQNADKNGKQVVIAAQHDGYHRFGISHQRSVACEASTFWVIEDDLVAIQNQTSKPVVADVTDSREFSEGGPPVARLHWLMPDWSWELEEKTGDLGINFRLRSPLGWIRLQIGIQPATPISDNQPGPRIQLIRAGELLHGTGSTSPVLGWVSPTYGYKIPALSLAVETEAKLPMRFTSLWEFPQES